MDDTRSTGPISLARGDGNIFYMVWNFFSVQMNISMVQMDLSKVQNWRFWTHASMPSWSPNPVFRAKVLVPLEMIFFWKWFEPISLS